MQDLIQQLASELDKDPRHVENVVRLLDEGNTIPFIARYRKELHGAMDDTALRAPGGAPPVPAQSGGAPGGGQARPSRSQGKLTEELSAAIDAARDAGGGGGPLPPLQAEAPHPGHHGPGEGAGASGGAAVCPGAGLPGPAGRRPPGYVDAGKGRGDGGGRPLRGPPTSSPSASATTPPSARPCGSLLERQGSSAPSAAAKEPEDTRLPALLRLLAGPSARLQGHQILAINRGEREGVLKVSRGAGPGAGPCIAVRRAV